MRENKDRTRDGVTTRRASRGRREKKGMTDGASEGEKETRGMKRESEGERPISLILFLNPNPT